MINFTLIRTAKKHDFCNFSCVRFFGESKKCNMMRANLLKTTFFLSWQCASESSLCRQAIRRNHEAAACTGNEKQ
jgi:hypothetical protein